VLAGDLIFDDEVSTGSGSDRVTIFAVLILAMTSDPVATALGTDSITVVDGSMAAIAGPPHVYSDSLQKH